jgi:hypothetical protein
MAAEDAEFREDEEPAALIETGRALVRRYMADAAPSIQPKTVDLLDMEGRIIDFKTSARRPVGITPDYNLQLTTYSMITPGSSGSCRLDTVTKTKTVELVQQSCEIGAEERRYAERLYPMVQEAMRDGIYPPAAAARSVPAGIAGAGANASGNSADESTSERLCQFGPCLSTGVNQGTERGRRRNQSEPALLRALRVAETAARTQVQGGMGRRVIRFRKPE